MKKLRFCLPLLFLCAALGAWAQTAASPATDPFKALSFLKGTWEAKAQGNGGVAASGTYTFLPELDGHILARHSTKAGCSGSKAFDCEHGDLLYVYEEMPGTPLKAIYFDNEGHVLQYDVSTPSPTTAVFLTDPSHPGPQFRLTYELKDAVMSGKFQMHMPGQTMWNSYLEWSGGKK